MTTAAITREETAPPQGRYVARVGDHLAEMAYTRRGAGVVSADHTRIPLDLEGQGIARALLDALLADAEAEGLRVLPLCPYVFAQYARHPRWRDRFVTAPGERAPRP